MAILQGTTPLFVIPFDGTGISVSDFDKAELTLTQKGQKTTHYLNEMIADPDENTLSYHFTEEETLALAKNEAMMWQIFVKIGSEVYGTDSARISVKGKDKGAVME